MFLKVEFNTGSGFFAAFYKTNLHNFQKFPSRLGLGFIEMHARTHTPFLSLEDLKKSQSQLLNTLKAMILLVRSKQLNCECVSTFY